MAMLNYREMSHMNYSEGSSSYHGITSKQKGNDRNIAPSHNTTLSPHYDAVSQFSHSSIDTNSELSLSSLATLNMQRIHSIQNKARETIDKQSSLSKLSLDDVNQHLAGLSTPTDSSVDNIVMEGVQDEEGDRTPLLTDGLSLADLANLHGSHLVTPEKTREPPSSSSNLSLSELASMHMPTCSIDNGCSSFNAINSPVQINPQFASFDFTTGFTTPKTGSTLSLSQLASLGSTTNSSKSTPKSLPFPNSTGGLAALATVHLNGLNDDNTSNPIDFSIKPPPGLVRSTEVNVINSKNAPLAEAMDKLTIERFCVNKAGASAFANVVCLRDRNKPKRLVKRHGHLRRKSWLTLIKPQKKQLTSFSFTTPSPDDYVRQKQRQVFNSFL